MNASLSSAIGTAFLRLRGSFCLIVFICMLGACQSAPSNPAPTALPALSQTIQAPVASPSFSGQFLAARHAQQQQDNAAASIFFSNAINFGQADEILLKYSFINHYQNGDLDAAIRLARMFERLGFDFGLAAEPAIAKAVQDRDWQALIALSEKIEVSDDFHILASGLRSLAYIGVGEPETALAIFHELESFIEVSQGTQQANMLLLGGYIFELLGNKEEAERYFRRVLAVSSNEYIVIYAGAGLWRLGYPAETRQLWQASLPADAAPLTLIAKMQAKTSLVYRAPNLDEIIARFLFDTSWLSKDSYHSNLLIARAHLAISIHASLDAAHLVLAEWYLNGDDIARAMRHLNAIKEHDPLYLRSQHLRLALAEKTKNTEGALSALMKELVFQDKLPAAQRAERALLAQAGGDMHRRLNQCNRALAFYQLSANYGMENYRLYRNMGICYEQTDQDIEAEQALLKAIEHNPNDAISLNYLGYWWADDGRHLERAITFIKRAVRLQPSSGYYADSLGWVYYRQGQFDTAVLWLEKAIQLTPTDAIISEHLGDAYWQTGRKHEARFKWQHALDMGVEPSRITALQDKLERGL